jgi:hypothetical protein
MRTFPERGRLAEERRHCPRCHRVLDASSIRPVERSLPFFDRKLSFDGTESRSSRRNENQLYPDRIGKNSTATVMLKYHVFQWKNVARREGKVFNDSTEWLVLLDEPFLRAGLRPESESTAARTDNDVRVIFEFDRIYNRLFSPQMPIHAPTVLSKGNLIN